MIVTCLYIYQYNVLQLDAHLSRVLLGFLKFSFAQV